MISSRCNKNSEAGFTLIELVVAVGLLALIMSIVAGSFYATAKAKQRTESRLELIAMGRMALNRMILDLNGAYVDSKDPSQTPFIGEQGGSSDAPNDTVSFTTSSFDPRQFGVGGNIAVIDYFLKENTKLEGTNFLQRKADPFPDQDLKEGGIEYDIAEQVAGLSIRYQDDNETWNSKWDNTSDGKLPRLIEIILHLKGEDGVTIQLRGVAAPMAWKPSEIKL